MGQPMSERHAAADVASETILFLLIPNFSMMAFTSAIEPLRQGRCYPVS